MRMRDDKYWPRDIAEVEEKVSLINEPLVAPDRTSEILNVCPGGSDLSARPSDADRKWTTTTAC